MVRIPIDAGLDPLQPTQRGPRAQFTPIDTRGLQAGLRTAAGLANNALNERQANADRVTLAKVNSTARGEMDELYRGLSEGYDGSQPGFVENVSARLEEQIQARLEGVDPRLRPTLEPSLRRMADGFASSARNYEDGQQRAYTLRGFEEVLDGEATALVRNAAFLPEARENLNEAVAALPAALQADARRAGLERLGRATVDHFIESDPARGLEVLERGDLDDVLSSDQVARAGRSLRSAQAANERAAKAERDRAEREAGTQTRAVLDDIEQRLGLGLPVDEARWSVLGEVSQSASRAVREEAELSRAGALAADALRQLPLNQAIGEVEGLRASLGPDASQRQVAALAAAERAVEGMTTALDRDPLQFAQRHRGGVAQLDLSDPEAAFLQRAAEAEDAAEFYGVEARYFTENEVGAFTRMLAGQSVDERLASVQALASAGRPGMVAELMPTVKPIAHGAAVLSMGGNAEFVRNVLIGQELRDGGQRAGVSNAEAQAMAREVFGDAFALLPQAQLSAMEAASYAYDGVAGQAGGAPDDVDQRTYHDILRQAVGGVAYDRRRGRVRNATEPGGPINVVRQVPVHGAIGIAEIGNGRRRRHVWLPPGTSEGSFTYLWRETSDASFEAALSADPVDRAGRPMRTRDLRHALPVAVAPGVYRLEVAPGRFASTATGLPVTLDFNRLAAEETQQ